MLMALVLFSARLGCALAFGRFTLMPCTVAVVRMMKMMRSTYAQIEQRRYVDLIVDVAIAAACCCHGRGSLRVGLGDARDEFVDEHAHVRGDFLHARVEIVVAEQARDRDAEARDGRQRARRPCRARWR